MNIDTQEDWWECLGNNLNNIKEITKKVGLFTEDKWDYFLKLRSDKDHKNIHKILEQIWNEAPDNRVIHKWRGWGNLCDLCSEYWVFEE